MKKVYVNEKWCLGCRLCEYNCAFAMSGHKDMVLALKGVKISPNIFVEESPDGKTCFAVSCRHCTDPLCAKACITGAITVKDKIVSIDKEKCVGCQTCILSCPNGAIIFDKTSKTGAIHKCELCINTESKTPACVVSCPNGAVVFEER